MQWMSVSSSRVSAVAHEDKTMYIRFPDGATYAYDNVNKSEYQSFINSPSIGRELFRFQNLHPYRRV